jgi:peptidoglycan/xylan/chitin deacetylase (PgdA/CDA1 family)
MRERLTTAVDDAVGPSVGDDAPILPEGRKFDAAQILPVLLYHSISDEPSQDERFAVSPARFEAHASAIEASGRTTVGIDNLARAMRGERSLPERVAVITFDDGFADTYDAVLSLARRQLRSTLYVTTGALGTAHRLARSQVVELAGMPGVELGAHTVHHRYLDELDDREIGEEVTASRRQLEDLVQRPVRSFAYPHGAHDARVRQAVIDAGYCSAVAVKNAVSHLGDDPFAIARWTVTADTTASRVAEVLNGEHVPRAWSRERIRTRAHRAFRRTRRRLTGPLARVDMSFDGTVAGEESTSAGDTGAGTLGAS